MHKNGNGLLGLESAVVLANSPTVPATVSQEAVELKEAEIPAAIFASDRMRDWNLFQMGACHLFFQLQRKIQPSARKHLHNPKSFVRRLNVCHASLLKRDPIYRQNFQVFNYYAQRLGLDFEVRRESDGAASSSSDVLEEMSPRRFQAANEFLLLMKRMLSSAPLAEQMAELDPKKLVKNFRTLTADRPGRKHRHMTAVELFERGDKSIHSICRKVDPNYAHKTLADQKRYRRSVQAAIDRAISRKAVTK
jgi:hypothetical protein